MEINEMEHSSLTHSISNLALLKSLHDFGVDLSLFSSADYIENVESGMMQSFELLESGLKQLYPKTMTFLEYEEINNSEKYAYLFTDTSQPEFCIIWSDPDLLDPFKNVTKHGFSTLQKKWSFNDFYVEMEYELFQSSLEIVFYFHFYGMVHQCIPLIKEIEKTAISLKSGGPSIWNTISA